MTYWISCRLIKKRSLKTYSDSVNKKLLHFYKRHVTENLLPFWKNALDVRRGGVYTCFNNAGYRLVSKDKYTWSQGRFLWLWSEVARLAAEGKRSEERRVGKECRGREGRASVRRKGRKLR